MTKHKKQSNNHKRIAFISTLDNHNPSSLNPLNGISFDGCFSFIAHQPLHMWCPETYTHCYCVSTAEASALIFYETVAHKHITAAVVFKQTDFLTFPLPLSIIFINAWVAYSWEISRSGDTNTYTSFTQLLYQNGNRETLSDSTTPDYYGGFTDSQRMIGSK